MDDITSRINEIFSSPEGMEKIKTLVNLFSSSQGGQSEEPPPAAQTAQTAQPSPPPPPPPPAGGNMGGMPDFDPAMLMRITQAMSMLRQGDPRIDLLTALRENLSDQRQQRVDEAIQLMRLLSLMPMLMEKGLLGGAPPPGGGRG